MLALGIVDARARNQRRFLLTLSDNESGLVLTLFDRLLAISASCRHREDLLALYATGGAFR